MKNHALLFISVYFTICLVAVIVIIPLFWNLQPYVSGIQVLSILFITMVAILSWVLYVIDRIEPLK
jgi:predicted transporter